MKVSPLRDDRSVDEHTCKLSRHLSETRGGAISWSSELRSLGPSGEARRLVTSDIKRPPNVIMQKDTKILFGISEIIDKYDGHAGFWDCIVYYPS